MSEPPAPETDKLRCKIYDQNLPNAVSYQEMVMHARKLERERDAERALADRLAALIEKPASEWGWEARHALTAWKEARTPAEKKSDFS